jgi:hypothetical protein
MPIHDWTRVDEGIFHDFHHEWISAIKRVLNAGVLPSEYYALAEQADTEVHARRRSRIAIRYSSGDRVVAMLEIVSPGNKGSRHASRGF